MAPAENAVAGDGSSDESTDDSPQPSSSSAEGICGVCGQTAAQMHYGAIACVGCKGFFRRALKKIDQLECLGNGTCEITKDARTNCRSCRLRACLKAGMNPAAVRPDRDFTGRQRKTKKAPVRPDPPAERIANANDDWNKRLSVEMRTMLMRLLNFETKISRGDSNQQIAKLYPLKAKTLREILENPALLTDKRSIMRYEPDRICKNHELSPIIYRRLIAAIDWVEYLSECLPQKLSLDDRIALVKGCFLPLLVFKVAARTSINTSNPNVLCMCNFSYIPRDVGKLYNDCYQWNNGLVDRVLDELVSPFREFKLSEEEVVCLSAIVVLNPLIKDLSEKASDMICELRNKVQECLFVVMRETRPGMSQVNFGNILLTLPVVWTLAGEMCENLVFAQTFSSFTIPLITSLFGCFPVEPFEQDKTVEKVKAITLSESPKVKQKYLERGTQTEHPLAIRRVAKRRLPVVQNCPVDVERRQFSLKEAPTDYTLAEMFDDVEQEGGSSAIAAKIVAEKFAAAASSNSVQQSDETKRTKRSNSFSLELTPMTQVTSNMTPVQALHSHHPHLLRTASFPTPQFILPNYTEQQVYYTWAPPIFPVAPTLPDYGLPPS